MLQKSVLTIALIQVGHVLAASCTVAGITVHSTQAKYLNENIYAQCNAGKATCYLEPSEADAEGIETTCPIQVLANRALGVFRPEETSRWPRAVVCFDINHASNVTESERGIIMKAMGHIQDRSNVRFITREECLTQYTEHHDWICGGACHNYVHFRTVNGTTCSSTVGMAGQGEQYVTLSPRCFKPKLNGTTEGILIHEINHSLGVKHEHQHQNRELIVIPSRMTVSPHNYVKLHDMNYTEYDIDSIMHYGSQSAICFPLDECKPDDQRPEVPSLQQKPQLPVIDDPDDSWVDTIDTPPITCLPPGIKFCDAVENPTDHQCTVATIEMCKTDISFGQRSGLSIGDIHTLQLMYPNPPLII